jgi:hypothetical protein
MILKEWMIKLRLLFKQSLKISCYSGGCAMKQKETLEDLEKSLKKKEIEANAAKLKGLNTHHGNLLLEINLIKSKIRKMNMGSR